MKLVITIEGLAEILKSVFSTAPVQSTTEVVVEKATSDAVGPGHQSHLSMPEPTVYEASETGDPAYVSGPLKPVHAPGTVIAGPPPGPGEPVQLDNNGLPWDNRINTSSRGKTAKGVWKKRPGLADGVYETIIEELKAAQAVPAPAETAVPAPAETDPSAAFNPPPAATSEIKTYAELNAAIGSAGKTIEEVTAAVTAAGLQSYQLLGGRQDLIPTVAAALGL